MFPKYLSIIIYLFLFFCFPSINSDVNDYEIILSEDSYSFNGKQVNDTVINITRSNNYLFKGSSSKCSIVVARQSFLYITLDSVTLENSERIPFLIERNSTVFLTLKGVNKITDESSYGAAVKVELGGSLKIDGDGTLVILGNSKNGIEGEEGSRLQTSGGTYNITCVNDGISFEDTMFLYESIFNIKTSKGVGIKSDSRNPNPGYNGDIAIMGATFNINSYSDAILSNNYIDIIDSNFTIKTENGKGLSVTNTQEKDHIEIIIKTATFYLDTEDDAIYSSGDLTIQNGDFNIVTGKNGIHSIKRLTFGQYKNEIPTPQININKSLKGFEGSKIVIHSGIHNITASNSGIFSGGDSTNNKQSLNYGNLNYRKINKRDLQSTDESDIYISGGKIYINSEKNGIEAKGDISISGGNLVLWGAKSGSEGDFVNLNGKMVISGGTLFGAGNVKQPDKWLLSQDKINGANKVNENDYISIVRKNITKKYYKAPKSVDYLYYTDPKVNSTFYNFSLTYTKPNITGDEDENNDEDSFYRFEEEDSDEDDEDDFLPIHKKGENIKYNIVLLMMIIAFILSV